MDPCPRVGGVRTCSAHPLRWRAPNLDLIAVSTHSDLLLRLDAHLARVSRRVRMRRLVVTLSVAGFALGIVGAGFASVEALTTRFGGEGWMHWGTAVRPILLLGVLAAAVRAWTTGVSRDRLAREVDRRLGLADRTSSALAVAGGHVISSLGTRLLVETSERLDAASATLDEAFPARPRRSLMALLRAGSIAVAAWVAVILLSHFVGSGGGGTSFDQLPGTAPEAADTGDAEPAPEPPPPDESDDPEPEPDVEPEPEPDTPEPEPEPPQPPPGPLATAELVLSAEEFDEGDALLTLAVGKPGAGLTAPRGFTIAIEVDGQPLGTGKSVALSPAEAGGGIVPIRIGRLPGGPEALRPGQHEAVLVLEPEGGGEAIRSEQKSFRIRGGDDGGGGGGSPPPPPDQPEPEPEPAPPEEQPPDEGGGEEEEEPAEGEDPELPAETEKKIVVPLFDEGLEVEKIGPRLVLVPGGGPDDPPRRVPLEEALADAQRRAEAAVDRAGVRAADRELVRRYFERLRKLMDGVR